MSSLIGNDDDGHNLSQQLQKIHLFLYGGISKKSILCSRAVPTIRLVVIPSAVVEIVLKTKECLN